MQKNKTSNTNKTQSISQKIPELKTVIQLTGYIVSAIIGFLGLISNPPNLLVLMTGGLIAVTILVFGISLNQLENFPKNARAKFVITVFSAFLIAITVFLGLAIFFILSGKGQFHQGQAYELRSRLEQSVEKARDDQTRIQNSISDLNEQLIRAEEKPLANKLDIEKRLTKANAALLETRSLISKLEQLRDDLSRPRSNLIRIIQDTKLAIGESDASFNFISQAQAAIVQHGDLTKLEKQAVENLVRQRLNVAWLKYIGGNLREAVDIYEKVLRDDPSNEVALESLAELHSTQGNYVKSAQYFNRLISVYRADSIGNGGPLSFALANRGTIARFQNDFTEADSYFSEAQSILTSAIKNRDLYVALAANDVGYYYFTTGRFLKAESMFSKSLQYYNSKHIGEYGHSDILNNFGVFYRFVGNLESSARLLRNALQVMENSGERGSFGYGMVKYNLGTTLHLSGQVRESGNELDEAKLIFDRLDVSEDRHARLDFEIAMRRYNSTQDAVGLKNLHLAIERMIGATSPSHYRVIDMKQRLSEVLRAHGFYRQASDALTHFESASLSKIPKYIVDSYECERLLVDVTIPTSEPSELKARLVALEDSFQSHGESFSWIDHKFALIRIINNYHQNGERASGFDFCKVYKSPESNDIISLQFLKTIKSTIFANTSCDT